MNIGINEKIKLGNFQFVSHIQLQLQNILPQLLMVMIVTRFLDLIVGNDWFQSIFGSIDHNSMIMTLYDNQNFQLNHDFGVN